MTESLSTQSMVFLWWWNPRNWAIVWPRKTEGVYSQTFKREGQFGPLEIRWRTR